jgi:hypothetical protein
MKKLKLALASVLLMLSIAAVGVGAMVESARAIPPEQAACEGSGGIWTGVWPNGKCAQGPRTVPGTIKSVGNVLIFITGAISVLMIVIGGFRYTISAGDQGAITGAKNTILYAVVGLVVSVAAYAIVNLVLTNI